MREIPFVSGGRLFGLGPAAWSGLFAAVSGVGLVALLFPLDQFRPFGSSPGWQRAVWVWWSGHNIPTAVYGAGSSHITLLHPLREAGSPFVFALPVLTGAAAGLMSGLLSWWRSRCRPLKIGLVVTVGYLLGGALLWFLAIRGGIPPDDLRTGAEISRMSVFSIPFAVFIPSSATAALVRLLSK